MVNRLALIPILLFFWTSLLRGQNQPVHIEVLKNDVEIVPGEIFNLTFFVTNNSPENLPLNVSLVVPEEWKIIQKNQNLVLKPGEKKLLIFSLQVPLIYPVGKTEIILMATHATSNETIAEIITQISILKMNRISLHLIESPEHIVAGERFVASFLLQNQGNTTQNVFVDTYNCDVEGGASLEIEPGKSIQFSVYHQTSEQLTASTTVYFNVRATVAGEPEKSIYGSFTVFPSKQTREDLYFRYPVTATATYLATNRGENPEDAWQFEIQGNGPLDPEGKHKLEFLARGPGNKNLRYLGLYDQYFVSYENKNLAVFVGEKAYAFTPLTESSRFGMGFENKVIFNNGINMGFLYVKPRFYEGLQNEMAGFAGFTWKENNEVNAYYISKKYDGVGEPARLASLSAQFSPLKKLNLDVEFSRGFFNELGDNAFRGNINSQFLIFNIAANYYNTGKNYPGYYSNSTFYSGNFSANLTEDLSLGIYAKEDFRNADLDTFFVTAPYSNSFQAFVNFKIAQRAYMKFYWRDYEQKDRLKLDKFHYETRSLNLSFRHTIRKFDYDLLGEYGKTTNLLVQEGENRQNTFRGTANLAYRFNAANLVRLFGSWSNINSFVTGEQRYLTAGLSVMNRISKNLNTNLYLQNAYNIDDYFRNRNLMQFNLDYSFLKNHTLSLRSFYTLFKQQTEDPEFTFSLSYTYSLGVPMKQVINAGDLKGSITYTDGEPAEGVILSLRNKTTITDEQGVFWIKTIQPGRHLLHVDKTKFEIDEITNIPLPIEVEILEDLETTLNFKIVKGARITGTVNFKKPENQMLKEELPEPPNIILELKNEFEFFRITSNEDGRFSFPVVRPGKYVFRIFTNSIPSGYEIKKTLFNLELKPGENLEIPVILEPKERKIIFKPTENSLTLLSPGKPDSTGTINSLEKNSSKQSEEPEFYSIQIGAFAEQVPASSDYFKTESFDFTKQIDGLFKYFSGRFTTLQQAKKEKERLESVFKKPFIVKFADGKIIPWSDLKE